MYGFVQTYAIFFISLIFNNLLNRDFNGNKTPWANNETSLYQSKFGQDMLLYYFMIYGIHGLYGCIVHYLIQIDFPRITF